MHVVWVGDSITVGSAPVARNRIFDLGKFVQITTFAKVGAPLSWMAGHRIPDDADVVILAGGTNDLAAVSADKAFERLLQTRSTLAVSRKRVVVATIPPSAKQALETERFNEKIRSLPSSEFIDTGGKLSPSELSSDGIHPASYQRLGSLYADAILSLETRAKVEEAISWWPWVVGGVAAGAAVALLAHYRR